VEEGVVMRALKQGCTGEDVKYLQYKILTEYKIAIDVDGCYGPDTKRKVKIVQGQLGFTGKDVDGIVGPKTKKAMNLSEFVVDIYDKAQVWFAGAPYGAKVKPLKYLKDWAKDENADHVYNLAWYNMKEKDKKGRKVDEYGVVKGRTLTYLKGKGEDIGYGGVEDRVRIDAGNIAGGVKTLIKDGKKKSASILGKTTTCAIGLLKNGRFFIVQSLTNVSEAELRNYMYVNYQVDIMILQDGGGSVGKYDARRRILVAGKKEGTYGRPVATVVCVEGD
jgi:hypothetical protein